METQILWIVKNTRSEHLSRSSKSEEAKIRHHVQRRRLAAWRHRHRVARISTSFDPCCADLQPDERRSLQFFIQRTGPEWCGWQDGHFWNVLALQASQNDSAIVHGLVAIAGCHEYTLSPADSNRAAQLRKLTSQQYANAFSVASNVNNMTYCTSLISCVILTSLQTYYRRDYQFYRLLRSGRAMIEEVGKFEGSLSISTHCLVNESVRPLLDRLHARLCMMGDQFAALAHSIQHRKSQKQIKAELPPVPSLFINLRSASRLSRSHPQLGPRSCSRFTTLLQYLRILPHSPLRAYQSLANRS